MTTAFEAAGIISIGVGLALIYPPLAWIWFGVAAFGFAFAIALADRTKHHEPGAAERAALSDEPEQARTDDAQPSGTGETAVYAR